VVQSASGLVIENVGWDRNDFVQRYVDSCKLVAVPPVLVRDRVRCELTELFWEFFKSLVLNDERSTLLGSFESVDQTFFRDDAP